MKTDNVMVVIRNAIEGTTKVEGPMPRQQAQDWARAANGHGTGIVLSVQECDVEPAVAGRWHHGGGYLVCSTVRIAKADFDTNPAESFQSEVFDQICEVLNSSRLGPTH
jgi:hypothetical protein